MNDDINPDGVEINPEEVARTGRDLFPTVAGKFVTASNHVNSAQTDAAAGMLGSAMASSWGALNMLTDLFVKTSARHLEVCGDVLELVASDHAWTDEDNKYRIDESYHSTHAQEASVK